MERGYDLNGFAFVPPPRAAKKPRLTYEAASSVPTPRQPTGNPSGAAQSAPTYSGSQGSPSTSRGAAQGRSHASHGEPAQRGSADPRAGLAEAADDAFGFVYDSPAPPEPVASATSAPDPAVTLLQQEVLRLQERMMTLEKALGIGAGSAAAEQTSRRGVYTDLRRTVRKVTEEIGLLHERVDRRSSETTEMNERLSRVEYHSSSHAQTHSWVWLRVA